MKVRFSITFAKDLEGILDRKLLTRVDSLIEKTKAADRIADIPAVKRLSRRRGYYRVRVGDYRLGFQLEGNDVIFLRCLHRKDIYRNFPP